ncbi:MAG: 3-hydroxylacyl-ACP dehydratase [Polaromonas sp.]|nr:3-hydroxylacyl-ACP dehydratase [Polaromonas sp.]
MSLPATLDHTGIASRIPHHGRMCLLDAVQSWDGDHITCQASSHRATDNPLRANDRLGAACGIEYAAQAMAVHGALVGESLGGDSGAPKAGYLASIRSVALQVDRLDTVVGDLILKAERMTGDTATVLYSFTVEADGQVLLSGRAVVVLDAAGLVAAPAAVPVPGNA